MKLEAIFLVLLAPLPFWVLGMPWLLTGDSSRIRLAPLLGCALAGFYAELALVAGLPVRASVGVLTLASIGVVLQRRRAIQDHLRRAVMEWFPIYLVAVLAASLSPFPVLGNWSGDWLLLYQMGQSVVHGALPSDMLARPPLFGAAAAPLWILGSGLIPFQLMAAVASAAMVTTTFSFIEYFWPAPPRVVLLPLLMSPFFLHNTAAAWSKPLAAALILAAVTDGLRARRLASAALFALAVGVHEGSVVWAPCVLLAHGIAPAGWRGVVRALFPMAALGLLIVGPLEIWIFAKYGLTAKMAASPVLTEANHGSFAVKTLLAIVSSFVGWGPFVSLGRWMANPLRAAPSVVAKETYWLITSFITTLSGTLAGLLFPFLFVRRTRALSSRPGDLFNRWLLVGTLFAVVTSALLTPFYSNEGTMQAALVPLALGLYALFAGQLIPLDGKGAALTRRLTWIMILAGALPWLLLNVGTSTGLWLSSSFRERFRTGSEGDYFRVIDNHLAPLGMATFPEVPLLCIGLLVVWIWLQRRDVRYAVAPRQAAVPK
jgi:hypothetical protein